jgi:hypothetical protein
MSPRRYPKQRGPTIYLVCSIHGKRVGDIFLFPDGTISPIGGSECRKCNAEIVYQRRDFLAAIRKARNTGRPVPLRGYPMR